MTKFGLALPSGASSDGIVSTADDWDAFAEAYVIIHENRVFDESEFPCRLMRSDGPNNGVPLESWSEYDIEMLIRGTGTEFTKMLNDADTGALNGLDTIKTMT